MMAENPAPSDRSEPPAAPADPFPSPLAQAEAATLRAPRRRAARRGGPYLQLKQRLDKRTRLGRRAAALERALTEQIGGAPSAAEAALIRLAVTLDLRIELMRARLLTDHAGGEPAERHLLAWCNTLARTLRMLGLKAPPARPPSLADIIAESGS